MQQVRRSALSLRPLLVLTDGWAAYVRSVGVYEIPVRRGRGRQQEPLGQELPLRVSSATRGNALEALYVLAITTGMRQGELLALKWEDINFNTGKLQVRCSLHRSSQQQQGGMASELKTV